MRRCFAAAGLLVGLLAPRASASLPPAAASLPVVRMRTAPDTRRAAGPQVLPSSLAPAILASPTTVVLFAEDFESVSVPSARWDAYDANASRGQDYWGVVDLYDGYPAYSGRNSAYCAAVTDRVDGRYDDDMRAILVTRGPIYTDGGPVAIDFHYWNDSQAGADYLYMDVSCDGESWTSTSIFTGWSGGWRQDQTVVSGCPQLWLRFEFESDAAGNALGAYVDDLKVQGGPAAYPDLAWSVPPGWAAPIILSRTPGNHWDEPPITGQTTYFDFAVINQGGQPTAPCRARVDVGGAPAFVLDVPALSPGLQAIAEDATAVFPSDGAYAVEGLVDPDGVSSDGNPANNRYLRYVAASSPPRSELVVRSFTVSPDPAFAGELVTATVTLQNAGQLYAQVFHLGIYWNRAAPPPPGSPPDTTVFIANLLPGEQRTFTFARAFGAAADWSAYVRADVFNAEDEANEANNLAGPVPCRWRRLDLVVRDLGTGSEVGLRWPKFAGASCLIERAPLLESTFTPLATTTDTVWRDEDLPENQPWRYRVSGLRNGAVRARSLETIAAARLPLVLVHGISVLPLGRPDVPADTNLFWSAWRALLQDPGAPAARFEHVWMPALPKQGAMEVSEARLLDYLNARMDALADLNRREFGFAARPRQVAAVGYSAGGIYLRLLMHFHHGLVRRMVMVATPNGGSDVATWATLALMAARAIPGGTERACMDRPLVCQLTPEYMNSVLNAYVRGDPTPGVLAAGVAGNKPGTFSGLLPGEDDGYVQVKSVFHPAVFAGGGARRVVYKNHHELLRDADVLRDTVYPLLTGRAWGFASPGFLGERLSAPERRGEEGAAQWRMVEALADSGLTGESRVLALSLNGGVPTRVTVMSLDGAELELVLRGPLGAKRDSAGAGQAEDDAFARWPDGAPFTARSFTLGSPDPGAWQALVTVRTQLPGRSVFLVAVEESSAVSLAPDPAALAALPGATVWVRARLDSSGVPVRGAPVTCEALAPDGSRRLAMLADDGLHQDGAADDGVYAGALPAGGDGLHTLLFTASLQGGTASLPGGAVRRRALGSLEVGRVDRTPPSVNVDYPSAPWDVIFAGGPNLLRWTASDSAGVDSVALWFSLEDGSAHLPLAGSLPASGEFVWWTPNDLFNQAGRVRAVAFDRSRNWAVDSSDYPVVPIIVVDAARDSVARFGLRVLAASPATHPVLFEVATPAQGLAQLEVFDVAGRRIRSVLLGVLAAGIRRVTWNLDREDGGRVSSGVYVVRWRAAGRAMTRTLVVLR